MHVKIYREIEKEKNCNNVLARFKIEIKVNYLNEISPYGLII
jgi:hypothetical protein